MGGIEGIRQKIEDRKRANAVVGGKEEPPPVRAQSNIRYSNNPATEDKLGGQFPYDQTGYTNPKTRQWVDTSRLQQAGLPVGPYGDNFDNMDLTPDPRHSMDSERALALRNKIAALKANDPRVFDSNTGNIIDYNNQIQPGVNSAGELAKLVDPNGSGPGLMPGPATQGIDQTEPEPKDTRTAIQRLNDLMIKDKHGKPISVSDSFLLKLDLDQAIIQEGLLEPFRKKLEFARAKKFLKEVEVKELRRRGYTTEGFNGVAASPNKKMIGQDVRNTGDVAAKILPINGTTAAMRNAVRTRSREGQGMVKTPTRAGMNEVKIAKTTAIRTLATANQRLASLPHGSIIPQI